MANLARARHRLIWTLAGLAVLDVAAVVILVSPLVGSPTSQREQLKDVQARIQLQTRQVVPPDQMNTRVAEARQQIDAFYKERFPSEYSALSDTLGKLAAENGVTISKARYNTEETGSSGLRRVSVEASLVGNYLHEVKFINALERNQLFFLVNSVTLGEQKGGNVRLELKFETYLKGQS